MNVKVLVVYHAKAPHQIDPICKKYPDVFIPVLGGACTYQKGSDPFFDSMQRDDDGINISNLNKHINEFTVSYWGYQHQDRLGDPDMIGLAHYRRFMDLDYHNLDRNRIYLRRNIRVEQDFLARFFIRDDGYHVFTLILDYLVNLFPSYMVDFENVLKDATFFDKNMFIMNPHYLSRYMEFMLTIERVLFSPHVTAQVFACRPHHVEAVDRFIRERGRGYFTEYSSAVFFEHLRRLNYPIVVADQTKESYAKY